MNDMLQSAVNISSAQVISVFASLGVFAFVVLFAVIRDEIQSKHERVQRPANEWLFSHWDVKLYDTFFPKTKPEKVLKNLGVELEDYIKNCQLLKIQTLDLKKLAADKIIGIFMIFAGLIILMMSLMQGALISVIIIVAGYVIYQSNVKKIQRDANAKRKKLETELPRFLDLLQTALFIDITVSEAIIITAKHLHNTLISEELLESMADSQIGSASWQESLEAVAVKYEVDVFSDFVQYLITGYEKGLPIYDVVSRQNEEVRRVTTINAEESASKLNSSILIPIAVYKLVPMILLAMYPICIQIISGKLF